MLDFLKNLNPTVLETRNIRDRFIADVNFIENNFLEDMPKIVKTLADYPAIEKTIVLDELRTYLGKNKKFSEILMIIEKTFKNIVDGRKTIEKVLDKSFPKEFLSTNLNVRQITTLKFINDLEYIVGYYVIFIDYITAVANAEDGSEVHKDAVNKSKQLIMNLDVFIKNITFYENDNFFKTLQDLDTTTLSLGYTNEEDFKATEVIFESSFKDFSSSFNVSSFTGNIFLYIGMLYTNITIMRINSIKDRITHYNQKLTLLNYKKETGESNTALEKQIAYHSDKLKVNEHKLKKLSE